MGRKEEGREGEKLIKKEGGGKEREHGAGSPELEAGG